MEACGRAGAMQDTLRRKRLRIVVLHKRIIFRTRLHVVRMIRHHPVNTALKLSMASRPQTASRDPKLPHAYNGSFYIGYLGESYPSY